MIPEKAQGKVNQAVVVAIGPGAKDKVCLRKSVRFMGACDLLLYIAGRPDRSS